MNWDGELPANYRIRRQYNGRRRRDSSEPRSTEVDRGPGDLLPREILLLMCLRDGYTTAAIATELRYSERSIKAHIAELSDRYHAATRAQLVALAMRAGVI